MLQEATEEDVHGNDGAAPEGGALVETPEPTRSETPQLAPAEAAAPVMAVPPVVVAGTLEIRATVVPAFALVVPTPSVEIEPSVPVVAPAVEAAPSGSAPPVETPPAAEPPADGEPPVEAGDHLSDLMDRWLADGDRAAEAPPEDGVPPLEDSHSDPPRWLHTPDGRRFGFLLAGAALASVIVVSIARSYSHPTPPPERAETPITAAARPLAAAAPAVPAMPPPAVAHDARPAARVAETRPAGSRDLRPCRSAIRRGHARDAVPACRAAVDAAPRSAAALLLLARAQFLAGRPRDSLQLARRAATIDPRYPDPYLLIGNVEQTSGHRRDARAAFEAYLRLAPRGRHAAETRTVLSRL